MSIRLRLTLLYSAILALTLVMFGAALYAVVNYVIFADAQTTLKAETGSIASVILHGHGDPFAQASPFASAADANTFIQVRTPDGKVAIPAPNLPPNQTLPFPSSVQAALLQDSPPAPSVVTVGGQQVLLYSTVLVVFGDHVAGFLQVARSMQAIDQPLNVVRDALLAGGAVVILLAFGVGWLLAGMALRPINRLTQTAQEIGATQDFDRRVDYSGPPDEVGRLAGTFNTMLARLQAAYHTQRRFVADASHELRTPLTSIRGNLGLLQREPPIAEVDRVAVLADLVSESERLSRLVGDLLTLARSDAKRALRREPVPLAPLLEDLLRRLAVTYPNRTIHHHGGAGVAVLGDPDALTQVILILLDNALKFTPASGAVGVAVSDQGGQVAISVHDSGPGIDPEALPHIFERFYQGDTTRAGTGTGLGLAIAKALVDGQQGTLEVASRVGAGSVFTITLPRAVSTDRTAPPSTEGANRAPGTEPGEAPAAPVAGSSCS